MRLAGRRTALESVHVDGARRCDRIEKHSQFFVSQRDAGRLDVRLKAEPARRRAPGAPQRTFRLRLASFRPPLSAELHRAKPARRHEPAPFRRRLRRRIVFASVAGLGAPLIAARFPRAYLDVNRRPPNSMRGCSRTRFPSTIDREARASRRAWRHPPHRARRRGNLSPEAVRARSRRAHSIFYRPYHARSNACWSRDARAVRRSPSSWIAIPCRRQRRCPISCWATGWVWQQRRS